MTLAKTAPATRFSQPLNMTNRPAWTAPELGARRRPPPGARELEHLGRVGREEEDEEDLELPVADRPVDREDYEEILRQRRDVYRVVGVEEAQRRELEGMFKTFRGPAGV